MVKLLSVSVAPVAAGVLAWVFFPCTACAADTLRVGSHERFQSIASSVKAAVPGQVIELTSGTYKEAVVIAQRLVMKGVDPGGGLPVVTPGEGKSAFHLTGGGAVIENVAVMGSEDPVQDMTIPDLVRTDAGVLIESSGNQLKNLTLRHMRHGIVVFGDGNGIVDSVVSEKCGHRNCHPQRAWKFRVRQWPREEWRLRPLSRLAQ